MLLGLALLEQPPMDVFSLGCVIGEILLEGTALFDLSQLLKYRGGAYDPREVLLARVTSQNHDLVDLVSDMIKLDPGPCCEVASFWNAKSWSVLRKGFSGARLSAMSYLRSFGPRIFPSYFSPLLHTFCGNLLSTSVDARIAAVELNYDLILERLKDENSYQFEVESISGLVLVTQVAAGMEQSSRMAPSFAKRLLGVVM